MKRFICTLLALSMLLGLFAGCTAKDEASLTDSGSQQTAEVTQDEKNVSGELTVDELLNASWEDIEAQAVKEGKVTFMGWNAESLWMKTKELFENEYSGIKMEVVIADESKGLQKILTEAEGNECSIDLMVIGGTSIAPLIEGQLLAGPILEKTGLQDVLNASLCERQEGVVHNGMVVPIKTNQTGFLYNPRTVENPPMTWAELESWIDANPKKFGFCIPEKGGSGQAFMQVLIDQLCGGVDDYYNDVELDQSKVDQWSAVWDWLNARKDKITFTVSNSDSISRLNQGELDLVVAWDHNVIAAIANGELFSDAKMYIPEFGMPGGGDSVGVIKNAGNPAAALLLMRFLISKEAQQLAMDEFRNGPSRTDMVNGNSMLITEDLQYAVAWTPSVYKKKAIEEFSKNVLMQ